MDILKLLDSLSNKAPSKDSEIWIVACLGNPGKEYENTRHNAGFEAADMLANEYSCKFKSARKALETEFSLQGKRVILIKPQTYMNLSGEAVRAAADFYKVTSERIIVIYDDINLETGVLRMREKGSAGGHNGMKSIISHLGTDSFPRIRVGVGNKPNANADLANHVLAKPSKEDREKITSAIKRIPLILPLIFEGKLSEAQSLYCREK